MFFDVRIVVIFIFIGISKGNSIEQLKNPPKNNGTLLFPLVETNVKFDTIGSIHSRSIKLIKLETAFHRLCKMLRHPLVLQEILKHQFKLWGNKNRFIDGQKLIEMMGTISYKDGLQINIQKLRRGITLC